MPPEYAKYGQFSMKTDVFSFGVLVLEIVSGKRSNDCVEHLISYVSMYKLQMPSFVPYN